MCQQGSLHLSATLAVARYDAAQLVHLPRRRYLFWHITGYSSLRN